MGDAVMGRGEHWPLSGPTVYTDVKRHYSRGRVWVTALSSDPRR